MTTPPNSGQPTPRTSNTPPSNPTNAANQTITPMPAPSSVNAPHFKGKHVTEFLDSLELHATAVQIDLNSLPRHVLQYCSRKVRYTIESAPHWKQSDWAATHAYLIKLYGLNDRKHHFTMEKFRKWVDEYSDRKSFSNVQDVDWYY